MSLKQCTMDVSKDNRHKRQDSNDGGRKRKRMTAPLYKSLFKPQRIRIEAVGCDRCDHLSCWDPRVDNIQFGTWCCPVCEKSIKLDIPSVSGVPESIWDAREVEVLNAEGLLKQKQKQYFVKYKGRSHVHNQWITETQLAHKAPLLLEILSKKQSIMKWNEAWILPQQLLDKRLLLSYKPLNETQENADKVLNYHYEWLVKWQGLNFEQATWESEHSPVLVTAEGQNLIKEYENCHAKAKICASSYDKAKELSVELPTVPSGCPPGMENLHLSYVKKLHDNWTKRPSSVVFDHEREMRVVLFILSLKAVNQPFLIITTSSSLSEWEAMFLRVAPYNDVKVSVEDTNAQRSVKLLEVKKEGGQLVFQILLYHVDAFAKDLSLLKRIKWEAVIVDESQCSEIYSHYNHIKSLSSANRLLLFCGPLGESRAEYLNALSLLGCNGASPERIRSKMEPDDGLGKLKETLSQFIAYDCKSPSSKFVEFWVPVQISNLQLEQYCATLLSNSMALCSCSKTDTFGALRDVLISNRKCCDHPYIVDPSLEALVTKDLAFTKILDVGIKGSGKLQFLDLILPEMKKRQLRVLILYKPSESARGSASIGNILDEFVCQRFGEDSYERVDGVGILPSKKQSALNNFNNKDMGRFIFLLQYRACLPSIKLSSVDAIIVFDSDWNPVNDVRALQRITLDSRLEHIQIFRLYTSCTLEEKILRLAEYNVAIDRLPNLSRSTCDELLTWGASYLFDKLDEFHNASVLNSSSDNSFLNKVMKEFLNLVSHKGKGNDTNMSMITRAQQSCVTYGKNLPLPSELKSLKDGEQPHIFWRKLLGGRNPQWKCLPVSTPRQRKRPQYCEDSETSAGNDDVIKKRKRTANNSNEPVAWTPVTEEGEIVEANEGASGVAPHNITELLAGDGFWVTAVANQTSLHNLLKPDVSKLCKVLKLSEDIKIVVERFLEYVIENYRVNKESPNTLQAFLISLCWIGCSLLNHMIDRRESFAFAKKHLNFSCKEEEVNSVYSKLERAKEMFLLHTDNQKKHDVSEDSLPAPEATSTKPLDSRVSPSTPLDEVIILGYGQSENRKCEKLMENLDEENQKEIERFNKEWDEKGQKLENEYRLDKALIRTLHSNTSVRSERLKSLEKKFAKILEEHKRQRDIHLNDLKAMHLASAPVSSVPTEETSAQQHESVTNDVVEFTGAVDMGCNKENGESGTSSPEASRAIEDQNESNSPLVVASYEKVSSVSPASDYSVPTNLDIQDKSLQLEQFPCTGVQDKEVEGNSSSLEELEVENLQSVDAGQVNQFTSENSSIEPHEEPCSQLSINPTVPENQSNIPPTSELLPETTSEEQNVPYDSIAPTQLAENREDLFRGNPEEHLHDAPETPLGQLHPDRVDHQPSDELHNSSENPEVPPQVQLHPDRVDHQPSDELHNSSENPEVPPQVQLHPDRVDHQPSDELHNSSENPEVPPQVLEISAEIPTQDANSRPGLNLFGVQGHNQVNSQMPNQHLYSFDPLQDELNRLNKLKDDVFKFHEHMKLRLKSEWQKELAEISLKYKAKCQEEEAAFLLKNKEIDINLERVAMNKTLADAFRSKCQEPSPSAPVGMLPVLSEAGLMQHLHQYAMPPSIRPPPGFASAPHHQSSVRQQLPTPFPPLQLFHLPPPLLSTAPPRPRPNVHHHLTTTPPRPPPTINTITPSTANLPSNSQTCAPAPHIRPFRSSPQPPLPPPPPPPPLRTNIHGFHTNYTIPSFPPTSPFMAQASSHLPQPSPPPTPPPPRPSAATSQASLPRFPAVPTSQTGIHTTTHSLTTEDYRSRLINLSGLDLLIDDHHRDILQPPPDLRPNFERLNITEFGSNVNSSSGHDVVYLSDDD